MSMAKLLLCDVDGTLYQDNAFYKDYIRCLTRGTDRESWNAQLMEYVGKVVQGRALCMNSFYSLRDLSGLDFPEFASELEKGRVAQAEPYMADDRRNYVYLGDMWGVMKLIGVSLGITSEKSRLREVYLETRTIIRQRLKPNLSLNQAILGFNEHGTSILISNSMEETTREFLHQLQLEEIFSQYIYSAHKPQMLRESVEKRLPGCWAHPENIVMAGDNYLTDLSVPAHLGCTTVWINPYPGIHEPPYDVCLRSTDELAEYIRAL